SDALDSTRDGKSVPARIALLRSYAEERGHGALQTLRSLPRGARRRRPLRALRLSSRSARVRPAVAQFPKCDTHEGDDHHTKTVTSTGRMKRARFLVAGFIMIIEKVKPTSKLVTVSERNLQSAAI